MLQESNPPLTKKYQPKTVKEILGQEKALRELQLYLKDFQKGRRKAAILYGPPGSGKTIAVYTLAQEHNLEVLELNASDFRNADQIESVLGSAVKQRSLFSKGKIILVDEIDGLSGKQDRGGIQALTKLVSESRFPIICTANNPFDQKFASLRKKAALIEFQHLHYLAIYQVLQHICKKEHIQYEEDALKTLARMAGGDCRAAINDLQILTERKKKLEKRDVELLSQREQQETIIQALVKIFKTTDPSIAIASLNNVDEDYDRIMLWLDENMPKEYKKTEDLARAYDYLSKADMFNRRIRRWQHWRFLVYVNAFLTAGIAVSKKEKYPGFTGYQPPGRILKLWQANMKYQKRKSIAEKIAAKTHTSTSRVIQDTLPYIKEIFKKDKEQGRKLQEEFDLEQEEVEWMQEWR
ncbi:replication factor C large subunit [Candidatus Woesearchaeota archaeon]|nr:replication factor C large subunit [Candidatus Woesearchaeota archaeon]